MLTVVAVPSVLANVNGAPCNSDRAAVVNLCKVVHRGHENLSFHNVCVAVNLSYSYSIFGFRQVFGGGLVGVHEEITDVRCSLLIGSKELKSVLYAVFGIVEPHKSAVGCIRSVEVVGSEVHGGVLTCHEDVHICTVAHEGKAC